MNIRINKSSICFFLLTLAVTSIVIIGVTALPGFVAKVQADNLFVDNLATTPNKAIKSNSLPVDSKNLSIKSDSLSVDSKNLSIKPDNFPVKSNNLPFTSNLPVAVIISREIKPFIEMVEGFESALDQSVVRIFIDENSNPFSHDPLYKGTQIENYSFVITVGPSALSYIVKNNNLLDDKIPNFRKILYAMVLNPETIIPKGVSLCGISLNLFSEETISKITQVFPSVKKIGVLFDPVNNSEWFKTAQERGIFKGIRTTPIYIKEQSDVNRLNQKDVPDVDALLFIPDKTVTSPTIISHIIKQSIAKKIPVIGYNSFFDKSGAALSFILDYRKIGWQMAQKVMAISQEEFVQGEVARGKISHKKSCNPSTPAYYITLNRSVVDLLKIEIGSSLPLELKVEP